MMVDRVDIEVDNLMTNQVDGKRISKTMNYEVLPRHFLNLV